MSELKEIKNTTDEILQLVSFTLGEEEFGVEILKVQEINRMVPITKIPNTPDYVEGVINLRGKVIPIVDMRKRFGIQPKSDDKNTRIIVVELDNRVVGFIVDSVSEVLRIPQNITEPPPAIIAGIDADYIISVAKLEDRLLIMLDLEKIFSRNEKIAISEVA